MNRYLVLPVVVAIVCPAASAEADVKSQAEAKRLWKEASTLYGDSRYVEALEKFKAAYSVHPFPDLLLNTGSTLRELGRYAEAMDYFDRYLADPGAKVANKKQAQALLDGLAGKVGRLRIEVNEPGATVIVDGREIGQSPQALTMRVDPGAHTVIAEKAGASPAVATVTVSAGEERVVELRLAVAATEPPRPDPEPVVSPPIVATVAPLDQPDDLEPDETVVVAAPLRSRALPLGGFVRADVDGELRGFVAVVGGTYRPIDRVDVSLAAILGSSLGVWGGATVAVIPRRLTPIVSVGTPIFFEDGVHVGVHVAAGARWDVQPRLSAFAQLGVEHFLSVPDAPDRSYDETVFVPSIGLSARL